MFAFKPDYEQAKARIDAFWEREVLDRPVVHLFVEKPPEKQIPLPPSHHAMPAERWLDAGYQAELALATLSNWDFLGDSLPVAWPNLGPEIFSALYGCPMIYGDYGTSWSQPILHDWHDADRLQLDWDGPYLRKLHEMTDALLEIGRGKFITGMTDWHPGGDCIAAFRDPQNLAMDMLTHREDVKALLVRLEADYFRLYDLFYHKLRAAGQPISTWTSLVSDEKYYIPSNDFSCMISKKMFDDIFLPGLSNECRFLTHSIYHLDGPRALHHLDSILSIPELDALQWVPGYRQEEYHRWVWVYQKAQAAGKGVQVLCNVSELEEVMETLDPHGLFLSVRDVPSREVGEDILKRLATWCAGRVSSQQAKPRGMIYDG
ncbi:MAG: hypothetical protein IT330_12605 [Anaerolineae bacterium]|nr:hypothetical protein [Anaerolineae bacterium]